MRKLSKPDGNKLLDSSSLRWCTSLILLDRLLIWAKRADSEGSGDLPFSNLLKRCPCNTVVGHIWSSAACFIPPSLDLMKFKTMPEVQRNSLPFLASTSHTSAHIHTYPDTIFESYPLNGLSTTVCKFYLILSVDVGKRWTPHGLLITPLNQQGKTGQW